ncbi:apoptosis-inducing factor 3-like [Pollicipes pollicipes]|uniref:apoptosis-inducing factor 3-like n=1 Tax=Pollicipes pollicipes TaxID=41117 RepID=UPI001885A25B|nr:apoptosis-inducing factor 3-like [Pollicipes pollicipes]XP_037068460.1 apoptosis-inducing factor 3-like [Pollicipes pollicipes]XP_037068461.1 apoptosis-inducing factor 3-like [Pollicipes pollicipes]XP_037068462.1 apoptosis-inducing factor 3-like [Pollicipes pollicipes]
MGAILSHVCQLFHGKKREFVEGIVCQADELEDDEMRICDLAGEGRILVVKHQGQISALGTKCSHYGAPLDKGVVSNGRIRCPWHGACFNVSTGDIEDFPGLDGIPCYQVEVGDSGDVKVRAKRQHIHENKCTKQLGKRSDECKDVALVLGGGAAGASCVEALRESGFKGRVVLATKEKYLPYDRPKLSKALDMEAEKMQLRSTAFYEASDIEVLTEHEATSVDKDERKVCFKNGAELTYTSLVVATGSRPRVLAVPGSDLENVCVLRSPEDGNAVAARLLGRDVVIIGSSFIGMEVAAYCQGKAASVVVVGSSSVPYERSLGPKIGAMLQAMHEAKGIVFKMGLSVREFKGESGRLTQVLLTDGSELPADVCLMGVGVTPCTEMLRDVVKLDKHGNVVVDKRLRSSADGIYAAGDIASFPLPLADDELVVMGHWQLAHYHGRVAGRNAAGLQTDVSTVPFFWTQLFGKSIRYTGYCPKFDDVIFDGDVDEQKFVAFFCQGDKVKGVASMNRDPAAARWAERMAADGYPSKQRVMEELAEKRAAE